MKRLSILVMTALMALFLAACGDNVEKKVDASADTTVEAPKTDESVVVKPAESATTAPAEENKAPETTDAAPAQ